MQWWLIVVLVILAVLLLASLHPIRVRVEGSASERLNLSIVLRPFGIFPGRIKIVDIQDRPFAEKKDANRGKKRNQRRFFRFGRRKTGDGKSSKKGFFTGEDWRDLLEDALGRTRVEEFELQANLSGDPFHSGIACGVLWTLFGGGFAFLSHRVKAFPEKPIMNFGVDLERPWSAWWNLQIMLRVGDLVRLALRLLTVYLRRGKKNRQLSRAVD